MKFNHEEIHNGEYTFKVEENSKNEKLSKLKFQKLLKDFLTDKKYPAGCESKN